MPILKPDQRDAFEAIARPLLASVSPGDEDLVEDIDQILADLGERRPRHSGRHGFEIPSEVMDVALLLVTFLGGVFADTAKDVAVEATKKLLERWTKSAEPVTESERVAIVSSLERHGKELKLPADAVRSAAKGLDDFFVKHPSGLLIPKRPRDS
jgi:hypothetical protein